MNRVTEWLLSWAVSRGGVAVNYIVGLIIGAADSHHLVPQHDLTTIQQGLTSGGMALLTLAYAGLQLWIRNQHLAQQGAHIATALQTPPPSGAIVDFTKIGNENVCDFENRTGIRVVRAEPVSQ